MALNLNDCPGLGMVEITRQLFNHQFLSDVQFLVGDKQIYAHSFMLMLRSTVFQKQLAATINAPKLIPIDYVEYDSFYQFMEFIYTDMCDVTENNLIDLFTLAKRYKVIELENRIVNNKLIEQSQLPLFEKCLLENDQILIHKLTSLGHLKQYLLNDRFLSLSFDLIERLLKLEYTNVSELELFEALMRWINKNAEDNRIETSLQSIHYKKLLYLIRLPVLTIEQFAICTNQYHHLFSDNECLLLLRAHTKLVNIENFPWNVEQRRNFKLDDKMLKLYQSYLYNTNFSVSREMLLIGLWYGNVPQPYYNNATTEITFYQENLLIYSITRAMEASTKSIVLNLGESIRLQPNIEYKFTLSYYGISNQKNDVYCQSDGIFINIEPDLIKLGQVGTTMFGMFFKLPEN